MLLRNDQNYLKNVLDQLPRLDLLLPHHTNAFIAKLINIHLRVTTRATVFEENFHFEILVKFWAFPDWIWVNLLFAETADIVLNEGRVKGKTTDKLVFDRPFVNNPKV